MDSIREMAPLYPVRNGNKECSVDCCVHPRFYKFLPQTGAALPPLPSPSCPGRVSKGRAAASEPQTEVPRPVRACRACSGVCPLGRHIAPVTPPPLPRYQRDTHPLRAGGEGGPVCVDVLHGPPAHGEHGPAPNSRKGVGGHMCQQPIGSYPTAARMAVGSGAGAVASVPHDLALLSREK